MIGIVIAIREELTGFLSNHEFANHKQEEGNQPVYTSHIMNEVVVIESGMGKANAINATNKLIELYQPNLIISTGFAGAVRQNIESGTSYICNDLWSIPGSPAFWSIESAEKMHAIDENRAIKLNTIINESGSQIQLGSCMTVEQFVYNSDLKTWVGENFAVDVIDMESFWVSQQAKANNIGSIVIRVVLDPMEQKLPPFIVEAANNKASRTMLNGLKHIAIHPGDIKKIFEISLQVRKSKRILASNLECVIKSEKPLGSLPSKVG